MLSLSVSAQTPFIPEGGKKWDGRLDALVAGGTVQRIAAKGVQSPKHVLWRTSGAMITILFVI